MLHRRRKNPAAIFSLSAIIILVTVFSPPQITAQSYREAYRPRYHFTPAKNWMNDPNGMFYFDGEYHLFYQYNPFGDKWGHMSWGHAVSRDLVRWQHLPLALAEENEIMIFSGNAFVDWKNSGKFCIPARSGQAPCLIAAYTGHRENDRQTQNIAFSRDRGRSWTKFSRNPVIDINSRNFRDPFVMWHEATQKWVMATVLAEEHKVRFYGSRDLVKWNFLSDFGPAGAAGGIWECPNFFQLQVGDDPGEKKWLLKVDLNPGAIAGGSGGQYFVGEFDGTTFVNDNPADQTLWVDYGKDFYASQAWSDTPSPEKSRIWLGWMNNWEYAGETPTNPWRGAFSIPREVTLKKFPEGIRLVQTPSAALRRLRGRHIRYRDLPVADVNALLTRGKFAGEALEIKVEITTGAASQFGFKVRQGDSEETLVGYDSSRQEMFVDRTRSGDVEFHPKFSGRHAAPLRPENNRVMLHFFVDRSSIEVFGNDGRTVITDLIFPDQKSQRLELYENGGAVKIVSLDIWQLKSVW